MSLRLIKYFLITALGSALLFFAISMLLEYRPETVMEVDEFFGRNDASDDTLPDSMKIVSWNIGYAGLGDNMDFCVDGGERVRDSKERTIENLNSIIDRLRSFDADVIFLQEVDRKAHRTYGINEMEAISQALPGYLAYYAPNFKVWFVPSPLKEPIGQVDGGVVVLTKIKPLSVRRVQYPSGFPFPVSMFNLKRCILEADFKTADGRTVHLDNTHCTAFDTGGMRTEENKFLKTRLLSFAGDPFIVGGDWNQYPPEYIPGKAELENQFFVPEKFDTCGMNTYAKVVCDTTKYSMRFNDRPYNPLSSTKSILDFFVVSQSGLEAVSMEIIDLDFLSSDHNPVVMEVRFEK